MKKFPLSFERGIFIQAVYSSDFFIKSSIPHRASFAVLLWLLMEKA